jgi:protein-glutamine gamma-glutamyltransferase
MNLQRLHRRMAVSMGIAALVAFAGGAGFEPISASLAALALLLALFWQPDRGLSLKLEQVWLPLAILLVVRSLWHIFLVGDDVVIPVVDLLLLLLCAEALRSLDAHNDARLYALSFALLLASTAYRPGLLFAVAFVSYVALATVTLMVGNARRQAEANGMMDARLGSRFLLAMTGLSVVSLVGSAVVFLSFPRVSQGWVGRGETPTRSIVGFSDQVSLGEHGSRIFPNPQVVLRVEFPDGPPPSPEDLYWRGRSYDRFDGVRWSRSPRLTPSLALDRWYEGWGPERLNYRVYATPLDVKVLFTLHPTLSVQATEPRIQPLFDNSGDHIYWGSGPPVYDVVSVTARPDAERLRSARRGYSPSRRYYTQLPRLPQRVPDLAQRLTQDLTNDYDRAMAIERFLTTEFDYTLELPRSAREATLDYFLFDRRAGHCEYFSTAMVIMLRTLGIYAREVNGFHGGIWNNFGEFLAVTQNEAHSWVEVWFPEVGWVAFDPTPAGSGAGALATSWLWPGRLWLEGLQHQWSKWILDFSLQAQSDLLSRAADLFNGDGGSEDTAAPKGQLGRGLWSLAVVLTLLAGFVWANRGGRRYSPETKMYMSLRDNAERAGLSAGRGEPPRALVEEFRRRRHPGEGPAGRVVDLYLRARFAGDVLSDAERREMVEALGAARKSLR